MTTAYHVNTNRILPLDVTGLLPITKKVYRVFRCSGSAIWADETWARLFSRNKLHPDRIYLTVTPSSRGNLFESQDVVWSLESAVDILHQRRLAEAKIYREKARDCIMAAEQIERVDLHQEIFGHSKPETYVSPFTGDQHA